MLQISVLGSLAVTLNGAAMPLPPSKKTRALLAYLAVTARPHSRDRLSALLWPLPDDPRGALRWSLTRVRPLVDEPHCRRIVADRENVGFVSNGVTVDILSLRNLARNGTDTMSTDTPALKFVTVGKIDSREEVNLKRLHCLAQGIG